MKLAFVTFNFYIMSQDNSISLESVNGKEQKLSAVFLLRDFLFDS